MILRHDGEVALTSEARADIAVRVHQSVSSWQPRAVKRVYIPKAGDKKKLRPLGIPVILDRCAQALVQHLDAAFARIWTANHAERVLELQASAGLYTHVDGPHGRVPVGHLKIGLIALERRPHWTNDVLNDPRIHDSCLFREG